MKKASLILNLVTIAAVVGLYVLYFSGKTSDVSLKEANNEQLKVTKTENKISFPIAYVNADSLFENYEYAKDVEKELEKEKLGSESQFKSKYQALEKEYNDLMQGKYSQEEGMAKQQELVAKGQKLQDLHSKLTESLLKKQEEKNQLIQKSITEYLEKTYGNGKYVYILGYSQGGGILYAENSLNITNEVIEGLNKEYQSKKETEKVSNSKQK